jgi:hypothetical protein
MSKSKNKGFLQNGVHSRHCNNGHERFPKKNVGDLEDVQNGLGVEAFETCTCQPEFGNFSVTFSIEDGSLNSVTCLYDLHCAEVRTQEEKDCTKHRDFLEMSVTC